MKKTTSTQVQEPALGADNTNPPAPSASPRRQYDAAFRQQAVEHWLRSGKPGTQVAAELGVSYPALKCWRRSYTGDALPAAADLAAENRALKAELARVREQRDILKKTLGILAEPSKNATSASTR